MDDLLGTQSPVCRLTDPAAAVAELELVLPGLQAHRLPESRDVDWSRLASVLGTELPADYKLLCELYPMFEVGDFMLVGGATPGAEDAWVEGGRDLLEIAAEWCADADLTVPMHPYPAAGGLLPWSSSNQGDIFLWTTNPAGPQEWTVTVASRSGGWWHYVGGVVQFLADLVSGALEPWALPPVRPEITWVQR